ncbi:MAG TPA: peptide MFS transporter [Holophagaceae bacterium]|nr:peptide MFS transporter [Holophagaceae bacterium]
MNFALLQTPSGSGFGWILPALIFFGVLGLVLAPTFIEMRKHHPAGLRVLFFVEMWERFSYYGMRALLLLYMTADAAHGGLGWGLGKASLIYGTYTMSVYAFGLPGGWIADRFIGYRKAVFVGGLFIALGQFALVFKAVPFFFGGLLLIIIGTGLLKTNSTTLVGQLYPLGDARRDGGFSIYYVGINLGAFISPLICGWFAQDPAFMKMLSGMGLATNSGWHWGFAAGGVAMIAGLIQYALQQDKLGNAGIKTGAQEEAEERHSEKTPLTPEEWKRLAVVMILFVFSTLFWAVYEQAGSTLNIFADQHVRTSILGFSFPSTWYQSVNSFFIFLLAPLFAWAWVRLHAKGKEPSSPAKFAVGVFLVGAGMAFLIPVSKLIDAHGTMAGPYWLIGVYFLHTVGELCLSPVGLSLTSKLAPPKIAGMVMGLWFWSMALGNFLAGVAASLFIHMTLTQAFELIFAVMTVATVVLIALTPSIKKLMGGVH